MERLNDLPKFRPTAEVCAGAKRAQKFTLVLQSERNLSLSVFLYSYQAVCLPWTPFTAPVQTWLSVLESTSLPVGEVAFLSAVRISPMLSQGVRAHYRILFNIIVAYIQNSFHEPNTVKAVPIMWMQKVTIYSQLIKLLSPSAFFQCELEFG